jgi:hypothetical protein
MELEGMVMNTNFIRSQFITTFGVVRQTDGTQGCRASQPGRHYCLGAIFFDQVLKNGSGLGHGFIPSVITGGAQGWNRLCCSQHPSLVTGPLVELGGAHQFFKQPQNAGTGGFQGGVR